MRRGTTDFVGPFLTPYWRFSIGKSRRVHLSGSDEFGQPVLVTLCGKSYSAEDRSPAKRSSDKLSGDECPRCIEIHQDRIETLAREE